MKSEALEFLESRLAIGHINVQEFSVLRELNAIFNRLLKLLEGTYFGAIAWHHGSKLIAEEASDARTHLQSFHRLYSHTAAECQSVAMSGHAFDPSSSGDRRKVQEIRAEFKNDIERLPGTRELFQLISANFDDNIYHPFLESHRRHPSHPIWQLNCHLTTTCLALTELYSLVCEAEEWAGQIEKKLADFRRTCDEHAEGLALRESNENSLPPSCAFPRNHSEAAMSSGIVHKKTSYDSPSHPYGVGRSFSAIEEVVNRRPVTSKGNYIIHDTEATASLPQVGTVARRIGHVIPRVFTGSFSELEESIRKLRIPKPEESPRVQTAIAHPNGMMEVVTTPVFCTTPLSSVPQTPSPGQLLRRREALIERDVKFQDRVINGDVIRSRRPVEGEPETLTRWLNEGPQDERQVLPVTSPKDSTF